MLAHNLVPVIFENILEGYKQPDKAQQRSALFQIMGQLLKALQESPASIALEALAPFREEILSLSASNLTTPSTQELALFCLCQLAELPGCLSRQELVFAVQSITDVLVKPSPDAADGMAANALDALNSLAQLHPSDIEEITLPPLIQLLPDTPPRREDSAAISEYKVALAALATLCVSPALFDTFLIRVLSRVELLSSTPSEQSAEATSQAVLYAHHLLTTLRVVVEKKVKAGHRDIASCASRVLHRLFGLFISRNLEASSGHTVAASTKLIGDAGRIITLLVQQMDERYVNINLHSSESDTCCPTSEHNDQPWQSCKLPSSMGRYRVYQRK